MNGEITTRMHPALRVLNVIPATQWMAAALTDLLHALSDDDPSVAREEARALLDELQGYASTDGQPNA